MVDRIGKDGFSEKEKIDPVMEYKVILESAEYEYFPEEGEDEDGNTFGEVVRIFRLEGPDTDLSKAFSAIPYSAQQDILRDMYFHKLSLKDAIHNQQKQAKMVMEETGDLYAYKFKALLNIKV